MPIIAFTEKTLGGGQALARDVAERLDLPYVDEFLLAEHAAACWEQCDDLPLSLLQSPGLVDQLSRKRRRQVSVLQASLAELVRGGNAVCYGLASDLLTLEAPGILRVLVDASYPSRIKAAEAELDVSRDEAKEILHRENSIREWRRYLYSIGIDAGAPRIDLTVVLDNSSADEAYPTINELAEQRAISEQTRQLLEDFAVQTLVKAELTMDPATAHLELEVWAKSGRVILSGQIQSAEEQLQTVQRLVASVPGVTAIDSSGVSSTPPELAVLPPAINATSRWWRAPLRYVLAGAAAVAVLAFAFLVFSTTRSAQLVPRTYAGVITDTQCAGTGAKAEDAACVRECVKRPGVKYALYDGRKTYVISNQAAAEKLAAQHVVVKGSVDTNTGMLLVDYMQAR